EGRQYQRVRSAARAGFGEQSASSRDPGAERARGRISQAQAAAQSPIRAATRAHHIGRGFDSGATGGRSCPRVVAGHAHGPSRAGARGCRSRHCAEGTVEGRALGADSDAAAFHCVQQSRISQLRSPVAGRLQSQLDRDTVDVVPDLSGRPHSRRQMVAESNVRDAQARLEQAREGAALDSRVALNTLRQAEATFEASAGTASQAQRAYEIAEVRYKEGISTQLELNDTRNQLAQALV